MSNFPMLRVNVTWLQIMAWRWGFWLRFFGRGFGVVNHNEMRPLFSERYSGRYGVRKRTYIHFGPWCLRIFDDRASRKRA